MYLKWEEKTIVDFSDKNINDLYDRGFVFTRTGKGDIYKTRSVRINLNKFELSSENRRILRKTEELELDIKPIPYSEYSWRIGKLGKDFYEEKFGKGTFSANKIKELLTDKEKSNFNFLLTYCHSEESKNLLKEGSFAPTQDDSRVVQDDKCIGYCICHETNEIIHYSYPFYNLNTDNPNTGMGMMIRAVAWAKENNKKYIYLGSASSTKSLYKFQFKGIEWFNKEDGWTGDIKKIKVYLTDR